MLSSFPTDKPASLPAVCPVHRPEAVASALSVFAQMTWPLLRAEFPALSPAQLHHILTQSQAASEVGCVAAWQEDSPAAFKTGERTALVRLRCTGGGVICALGSASVVVVLYPPHCCRAVKPALGCVPRGTFLRPASTGWLSQVLLVLRVFYGACNLLCFAGVPA